MGCATPGPGMCQSNPRGYWLANENHPAAASRSARRRTSVLLGFCQGVTLFLGGGLGLDDLGDVLGGGAAEVDGDGIESESSSGSRVAGGVQVGGLAMLCFS
jgi:hypothetical protein